MRLLYGLLYLSTLSTWVGSDLQYILFFLLFCFFGLWVGEGLGAQRNVSFVDAWSYDLEGKHRE